jgi:hypothetical protein
LSGARRGNWGKMGPCCPPVSSVHITATDWKVCGWGSGGWVVAWCDVVGVGVGRGARGGQGV